MTLIDPGERSLGAVADGYGSAAGMYVGAAVLALGAVFYVAAGHSRERTAPQEPVPVG